MDRVEWGPQVNQALLPEEGAHLTQLPLQDLLELSHWVLELLPLDMVAATSQHPSCPQRFSPLPQEPVHGSPDRHPQ